MTQSHLAHLGESNIIFTSPIFVLVGFYFKQVVDFMKLETSSQSQQSNIPLSQSKKKKIPLSQRDCSFSIEK